MAQRPFPSNEGFSQVSAAQRNADSQKFIDEFVNGNEPPHKVTKSFFDIPIEEFAPIGTGLHNGVQVCMGINSDYRMILFFQNLTVYGEYDDGSGALIRVANEAVIRKVGNEIIYMVRHQSNLNCGNIPLANLVERAVNTRRNHNRRFKRIVSERLQHNLDLVVSGNWIGNNLFDYFRGLPGITHLRIHFLLHDTDLTIAPRPMIDHLVGISFEGIDNNCQSLGNIYGTIPNPGGDGGNGMRPCPQYSPCQ